MKKLLLLSSIIIFTGFSVFAQEDDNNNENEKIREKMSEFIQKRMRLSNEEAQKFNPVFIRYFREWRKTVKDNRGDKLILQQRVIELQLRYRNEFKEIVGEKRSNDIYQHQQVFIKELRGLREERLKNNIEARPNKKFRSLLQ